MSAPHTLNDPRVARDLQELEQDMDAACAAARIEAGLCFDFLTLAMRGDASAAAEFAPRVIDRHCLPDFTYDHGAQNVVGVQWKKRRQALHELMADLVMEETCQTNMQQLMQLVVTLAYGSVPLQQQVMGARAVIEDMAEAFSRQGARA